MMLSYEAKRHFLQSLSRGEPETLAQVMLYDVFMQIVFREDRAVSGNVYLHA